MTFKEVASNDETLLFYTIFLKFNLRNFIKFQKK